MPVGWTGACCRTPFRDRRAARLQQRGRGPDGADPSVRPNQILPASLPASLLDPEHRVGVVAACRRDMLSPFGLRTLAPGHPKYRGQHLGAVPDRDAAYHQGTIWGWLLGRFAPEPGCYGRARPRRAPRPNGISRREQNTESAGAKRHRADIYCSFLDIRPCAGIAGGRSLR
jgi:hypothetical protein